MVPTLNTVGRPGYNCVDETSIAFVRLSEVAILSTLLLLIKWLPSTQWLSCTCATINKNSFGECFNQLLTTPAKLGQQVNWYHKPSPDQRRKEIPRNSTSKDRHFFYIKRGLYSRSSEIMGAFMQSLPSEMTQTWIGHVVCLWHAVKIFSSFFVLPSGYVEQTNSDILDWN